MSDLKSKFIKTYANLPLNLRNEIVIVIDDEPLTWNACWVEVENNTNILVISILKGLKTYQAYKKSQNAMIKNFMYMISSKANSFEKEAASFLWLNIKNQVILGNKEGQI